MFDPSVAISPVAGLLTAWLNAVLRGAAAPDDLLAHLAPVTPAERVLELLAEVRRTGANRTRLALPVPGDPSDLPGPTQFTEAAIEIGQACCTVGSLQARAFIPEEHEDLALWAVWEVENRPIHEPTPGDADRALLEVLHDVTARWDRGGVPPRGVDPAEVAEVLGRSRRGAENQSSALPQDLPPRVHRLLDRAEAVLSIVDAARTHGAENLTAAGTQGREQDLRDLATAARRAVAACWSAAPAC
jgi:hypothetical protein